RSVSFTPLTGDVVSEYARVDGSFSLTPAPALSGAGTISRIVWGERPTTLGTFQLNWFPLRGELQLALALSNTLDTAAEATTRLFTPSLRWNVRRGVAWTSSYTWLESDAPTQALSSRAFMTSLLITL
ncbi:MAG TPA: hypothetical protein VD838_12185, partial [Anaeromyxobacteraceae bacterium]|nr:hypothetical protein [Anaeromyxobacteraceae bacterium]